MRRKDYCFVMFNRCENKLVLDIMKEYGLTFNNNGVQEVLKELSTNDAKIFIDNHRVVIRSEKYGEMIRDFSQKIGGINMKRVLFLDFDGVINLTGDKSKIIKEKCIDEGHIRWCDPITLGPLAELLSYCYYNDIYIVVSSSWRCMGLELFTNVIPDLTSSWLMCEVFRGYTPYICNFAENWTDYNKYNRSYECALWLKEYAPEVEEYVFLDDDYGFFTDDDKKRLVRTNVENGLTYEDVEKVKQMFDKGATKGIPRLQDTIADEVLGMLTNDRDIMFKKAIYLDKKEMIKWRA